ncbi:MAG: hypothetical protein A2V66_07440 [Ignavibacteria bacterium RBG_13_36_8]|nr:MAG: hypothetical protein A2V66_07440 [Ignavibacteria bacterium RBG_13_36_8]
MFLIKMKLSRVIPSTIKTALILLLTITLNSNAQETNTISNDGKTALVKELTEKLEKYYTYPEIGKKLKLEINKKLDAGEYSKLTTVGEFTQQLTEDLIAISNDTHFLLFHDPERAAYMLAADEGNKEDLGEYLKEERRWSNFGFKELKILEGAVGYLDLREFCDVKFAGETATAAMNFFSDCNALIIDLRNNGGGRDEMVTYLASYFLDSDEAVILNITYSTVDDSYWSSMTSTYVPGKKLSDIPLYILTSNSTASAAEGFSNIMKHLNENATLIGEKTSGAENPVNYIVVDKEFVLRIPSWRKIYSKISSGWEAEGITPDIEVESAKALLTAHIYALEKLIENTSDQNKIKHLKWSFDGVKAEQSPAAVSEDILRQYVGKYGNRDIYYEGSNLLYQYKGKTKRKMLAISSDYFVVEDYDWFRVKFNIENGIVKGFEEVYSDGGSTILNKE